MSIDSEVSRLRPAQGRPWRFLTIVAAVSLMTACASAVTWQKPGVDAATMEQDRNACRHEAMRAEVAIRGPLDEPFGSGPKSIPRVASQSGYLGDGGLSGPDTHAIFRQCLENRGYQPSGPT